MIVPSRRMQVSAAEASALREVAFHSKDLSVVVPQETIMASEESVAIVISALNRDYVSFDVLRKSLGADEDVQPTLNVLIQRGLVEALSLLGGSKEHFKLTEKGLRFKHQSGSTARETRERRREEWVKSERGLRGTSR